MKEIEIGPDGSPIVKEVPSKFKVPSLDEVKSISSDGANTPLDEMKEVLDKETKYTFDATRIGFPINEPTKQDILNKLTSILFKYEFESNIPPSHEYWKLVNLYRSM